jgi:hypothetical protein
MFAVADIPVTELLTRRFSSFRVIYLPNAAQLTQAGFGLLPTGQRPHFTVRLVRADDRELGDLLIALRPAQANPGYAGSRIWREEG